MEIIAPINNKNYKLQSQRKLQNEDRTGRRSSNYRSEKT